MAAGAIRAEKKRSPDDEDPVAASYIAYMKARVAELRGNREAAEAFYWAAIKAADNPQPIYVDLGILYKRMGQWDDALRVLKKALELNGDDARAYREIGEVYEMRSLIHDSKADRKKALESYRAYLERIEKPDNRVLMRVLTTLTGDGRGDEALAWAEHFVKKWPDNVDLWRFLGHRYDRMGRTEDAERAFRKWVELEPDSADAWQALTRFLIDHDRESEAVEGLRRLWRLKPDNFDLLRALIRAYRDERRFDAAESLVQSYLKDHPGDARAYRLLVDIVADRDGPSQAVAFLDKTLKAHPDLDNRWNFQIARLWLLYRARRYREAVAEADRLLKELQGSPADLPEGSVPRYRRMLLFQKGLMLHLLGESERAVPILDEAVKIQDNPETREVLILALLDVRDLKRARSVLDTAMERFPNETDRWTVLEAQVTEAEGHIDRALSLLDRLPPDDAWQQKVMLLHRQNRFAEALGIVRNVLAKEPDNPDARFYLASTLERLKRYDEAAREFQQLLAKHPDNARALNYLGYMWIERGEHLDEAIQLVRRALKLDPENPAYLDSLAWGYYRKGDPETARTYIDETLRRIDTDPLILDHAGDIYAALGEHEKAVGFWKSALEHYARHADNPDFHAEDVRDKIRRLCTEHPAPACASMMTLK